MASRLDRVGHGDTNPDGQSSIQYQQEKHFPCQLLSGLSSDERSQHCDQDQWRSNRSQHSQNQTRGNVEILRPTIRQNHTGDDTERESKSDSDVERNPVHVSLSLKNSLQLSDN